MWWAAWGRHLPHILASSRPPVCSLVIRHILCPYDACTKRHAGVPHIARQPPAATRRAAPACNTNTGNLCERPAGPNFVFSETTDREKSHHTDPQNEYASLFSSVLTQKVTVAVTVWSTCGRYPVQISLGQRLFLLYEFCDCCWRFKSTWIACYRRWNQ